MIRESLIFAFLALAIWSLHGIDVQYYAMTSPYLFEVNLMLCLISIVAVGVLSSMEFYVRGRK